MRPPLNDCISEITNTQIENSKGSDVAITLYNLIEFGDNYSKISTSSRQYYRVKQALVNSTIVNFAADNNSFLFKFKQTKQVTMEQKPKQVTMEQKMLKQWCH